MLIMLEKIFLGEKKDDIKLQEVSSLSLAFLGDAVWTLLVREYLLEQTTYKNTTLHKLSTQFVKASYQAKFFDKIEDGLCQEEFLIAKRARNCKMTTMAKHATYVDYKKATSLEALIGYYYLTNQFEKIEKLNQLLIIDIKNCLQNNKQNN